MLHKSVINGLVLATPLFLSFAILFFFFTVCGGFRLIL